MYDKQLDTQLIVPLVTTPCLGQYTIIDKIRQKRQTESYINVKTAKSYMKR